MERTIRSSLPEILTGLLLAGIAASWLLALARLAPEPLAWTFTRLAGVAGYALLTTSVALGALMGSRLVPRWLGRPLQAGWHGVLSGFALALVGTHIAYTLVDARYPQPLAGVLLPGLATYAPLALALGTLASYALITVQISFAQRKHLPRRTWRALHLLAYPAFALSTLHGIFAGSDTLAWLYLPAVALVGAVTAMRVLERRTLVS